jgi:hypothetical protein
VIQSSADALEGVTTMSLYLWADVFMSVFMVVCNRFPVADLGPEIGIGGRVAPPPLPHHRTCGSASGGSAD